MSATGGPQTNRRQCEESYPGIALTVEEHEACHLHLWIYKQCFFGDGKHGSPSQSVVLRGIGVTKPSDLISPNSGFRGIQIRQNVRHPLHSAQFCHQKVGTIRNCGPERVEVEGLEKVQQSPESTLAHELAPRARAAKSLV